MAQLSLHSHGSVQSLGAARWDGCAPDTPFTTYRFLNALEESGSVGQGTGWQPHHLELRAGDETVAVAPMYLKMHSQGEYVFDHSWARAYEEAGGNYYPKLQIAVPFTPVSGRRFLSKAGYEDIAPRAFFQAAQSIAQDNGLSSLHITFCSESEAAQAEGLGLLYREGQQFHWQNDGYASFDAFLDALSARKRKMLRKEREATAHLEIECLTGDAITPHHWDAFWEFYQDTGARKWGTPYLTRAFFDIAQRDLRADILLVLAYREGQPIAGALNFIGQDALYGRYWGAVEHHPFLHFELCYYRAIDYAISQGLSRVEAGAQGEHKLARGYLPHATHSLHWFANRGFHTAVANYLEREIVAVEEDMEALAAYSPFKA